MNRFSTAQLTGALAISLSGLIVTSRLFHFPQLVAFLPGAEIIGALNLLLLCCMGIALILLSRGWATLSRFSKMIVLTSLLLLQVIPCSFLFEAFTGIPLGIDIAPPGMKPTLMSPHPGRISPNASVAYLAIGIAIFFLIQSKSRVRNRLALAATAIAGLISVSAILGRALGLESLYKVAGLNQMLPGTAVAICACVIGLWTLIGPVHEIVKRGQAMERDINRRAVIIITLVAISGGIGGFAVLRSGFEAAAASNMLATTQTAAASLVGEIEANLWYPKVIAERTSVHVAFAGLLHARNRAAAAPFERVAERFFNEQVTGAQFLDPKGSVVHQFGSLVSDASGLRHPLLIAEQNATLIWSNGYVLETRNEILDGKVLLGVLVIQTRLPRFDTAIAQLRQASKATDAAICSKIGVMAICAPTRLRLKAFTLRLDADPTTAASTIGLALAGESGALLVRDPAGINVISAFVPLKNFGLALGVKSDVQALYAPLRARLLQLLVVLTALVLASAIALRSQLRPLVAALAKEQRRTANILENSNDAFVALDSDGRVTDWNAQATRMFGWSTDEALGRSLSTLIVPPAARLIHEAGMRQFRQTGTGAVVNHRIELQAMHKSGHMVPVELSVKAEQVGEEYIAHAFLHDISERKDAQDALLQSEQRVKLIANNLPALVSYIDHDFRYMFTNIRYQNWFGREDDAFTGKTVEEVFGATVFNGVREQIERALGGEDVTFELTNPIPGSPANILVHYIPDRDQNGNVVGVFGMVLDRTEQHEAKRRVEASERQLRAVTDNLPVLITYIGSDEKLRFMNEAFSEWVGVNTADAIDRPLAEVLGEELYKQRHEQIRRALSGERVEFDVASDARGSRRYLHTVYVPDTRADGSTHGVFTVSTDVTPLKKIENELRELSRVDTLTGLANRRHFNERLEEALARTKRGTVSMALMFLDIDLFKSINDTYGHAAGDMVLTTLASRLQCGVRNTDLVARLAGDEFVVIMENVASRDDASRFAEKLISTTRLPIEIAGLQITATFSIGIALTDGKAVDKDMILDYADQALYSAKSAGRNCFIIHNEVVAP